jgi:hypothetical protein
MPARRAKRSTRRTPARRKGVRKTIVTLKPLNTAVAASGVGASAVAAAATGGDNTGQARILQLEAENRQLKVQLAEQRNSSTMISAPLGKPERSYKGMAITFALTTIVLLVVVLLLST